MQSVQIGDIVIHYRYAPQKGAAPVFVFINSLGANSASGTMCWQGWTKRPAPSRQARARALGIGTRPTPLPATPLIWPG